eukprot:g1.t1
MSNVLVNRIDSAHMKRMFDMALQSSDVNFLSATTSVSIEQVKNLKLDNDVNETVLLKTQPKPPQPPKPPVERGFSLSNFDLFLDDLDAESWLVSSETGDSTSKNKSHTLLDSTTSLIDSPLQSSASTEIKNLSLTPVSVSNDKQIKSCNRLTSESPEYRKSSDAQSACTKSECNSRIVNSGSQDILHRPRSMGSVNHTMAPTTKKKPPKAVSSIMRPKSSMENEKPLEDIINGSGDEVVSKVKSRIPYLGFTQKRSGSSASPEARRKKDDIKSTGKSLTSLAARCRPSSKSVGPSKQSRLPPLSPTPRPKSSIGKSNKGTVKDVKRSAGGRKLASSVPPARPPSALRKEDKTSGKKNTGINKGVKKGV